MRVATDRGKEQPRDVGGRASEESEEDGPDRKQQDLILSSLL